MTLRDFIEKNKIAGELKPKIPNKTMKKYMNSFKYIEVQELWYDDFDHPHKNTWTDIEGIGYGWIWLNYENSERLQRKAIIRFAMGSYKECKNEIYIRRARDTSEIILENKNGNSIIRIRVSNKELYWWQ